MSRPKKPAADDIVRAERLRDLREARWLTPSELAIRSGIDLSEICRLESGISKFTSPKIQQKLAAVYECSVGDLVNYVLSSGPAPDGSLSRGVAAAQSECVCDGLQANLQKQLSDALGQAAQMRKECAKLRAEAQRLRSEASIDSSSAIIARVEHRSAVAEADELRRLAWEWCIEASVWRDATVDWQNAEIRKSNKLRAENDDLRAQLQRLTDDAYEVDHRGNCPAHEPIESLGPVPADVPGSLRSRVEWLIRDAVRRGAKLEGDDR